MKNSGSRFFYKSPLFRFLFFFVVIYALFYVFHEWVIKEFTLWDEKFISHIINFSDLILRLMGFKTFKTLNESGIQALGIDGSNGIWVGSPCNAITLFGLFASFLLPFPGNQKNKIWFIPLGILIIHFSNILRVVALCLIANYAPFTVEFNHTYTFTFLVYLIIFALWMLWVVSYSGINRSKS